MIYRLCISNYFDCLSANGLCTMATATSSVLRLSLCRSASACGSAMCNFQVSIHFEAVGRTFHANPEASAMQRQRVPILTSQFLPSLPTVPVKISPSHLRKGKVMIAVQKQEIHSALIGTGARNDAEASDGVLPAASRVSGTSQKFRMDAKTGAFQQLPVVSPADEILGSGIRRAKMVRPTKGIVNVAKRERNRGAKQLDALIKELALPLKTYVQKFPRMHELHAYESAVLDLTLGQGHYEQVLERVDLLRKRVLDIGKYHASVCAKSTTKREAEERLSEGFTRLEELFKNHGNAVDILKEQTMKLRAMPVISLRTPTLCLVGAPNVGKSSLVRILSSGKPEVCNYQFTTRGISIGHFEIDSRRFQVTDTPGLLERPDVERNNMEKLTLAALSHLPTSILYVHDLTEECGSSALKQHNIYLEMKKRYSDRPWLDVVSKADLLSPLRPSSSPFDRHSFDAYKQLGPKGALRVSIQTGDGVDELIQRVHALLSSAHPDETKDEQSTWDGERGDVANEPSVENYYYPAWPRKQEN